MNIDNIMKNGNDFFNNLSKHINLNPLKKFTAVVLIGVGLSSFAHADSTPTINMNVETAKYQNLLVKEDLAEKDFKKFSEIISNREVTTSLINESFYDEKDYSAIKEQYDLNMENYDQIFNQHIGLDKAFIINNPFTPKLKNIVFFSTPIDTQLQNTAFFIKNFQKEELIKRESASFIEINNQVNRKFFNVKMTQEESNILSFFILAHELGHTTPKQSQYNDSTISLKPLFTDVNDYGEGDSDILGYLYTSNTLGLTKKGNDFLSDKILLLRTNQYGYNNLIQSFYENVKMRANNIVPEFLIKKFLSAEDQEIYDNNVKNFNNHGTIKTMLILKNLEDKYGNVIKNLKGADYLLFSDAILKVDKDYSNEKFSKDIMNAIGTITKEDVSNFFNSELKKSTKDVFQSSNYNAKEQFILNLYQIAVTSGEITKSMEVLSRVGEDSISLNKEGIKFTSEFIEKRASQIFKDTFTIEQKNSFLVQMMGPKNANKIILDKPVIEEDFSHAFKEYVILKTIKDKFKNEAINESSAVKIKKAMKDLGI